MRATIGRLFAAGLLIVSGLEGTWVIRTLDWIARTFLLRDLWIAIVGMISLDFAFRAALVVIGLAILVPPKWWARLHVTWPRPGEAPSGKEAPELPLPGSLETVDHALHYIGHQSAQARRREAEKKSESSDDYLNALSQAGMLLSDEASKNRVIIYGRKQGKAKYRSVPIGYWDSHYLDVGRDSLNLAHTLIYARGERRQNTPPISDYELLRVSDGKIQELWPPPEEAVQPPIPLPLKVPMARCYAYFDQLQKDRLLKLALVFFNGTGEPVRIESVSGHLAYPSTLNLPTYPALAWADALTPQAPVKPWDEINIGIEQSVPSDAVVVLWEHFTSGKRVQIELHCRISVRAMTSGEVFDLMCWQGVMCMIDPMPTVSGRVVSVSVNIGLAPSASLEKK